jgi:hypothetical protein
MIGSRRIHLPIAIVSIGSRANTKEERHEKEGQEEIEGNVKRSGTRASLAESAFRAKSTKKSGPLTRGRFVIVTNLTCAGLRLSPTGTPAPDRNFILRTRGRR